MLYTTALLASDRSQSPRVAPEEGLQTELRDAPGPGAVDLSSAQIVYMFAVLLTWRRLAAVSRRDPSPLRVIEGVEAFPAKLQC